MKISQPLVLPCSQVLFNRLAKSAMSENMASPGHLAGESFYNLYRKWALGGVGLCISGNVMVDSRHLGETHNVVIEKGLDNLLQLRRWNEAKIGTQMKIWIQLNHPGKQSPKILNKKPLAPSPIALRPPLNKWFAQPTELNEGQIYQIIERFAFAASVVKSSGLDGVQIHGAHGYLVSQFLSPLSNQRKDRWGGNLQNRMRFALEIYKAIRKSVGPKFPIGIKINSADFQKGGFTVEESLEVGKKLSELGLDLLEISGGSYEAPVMMKDFQKESTKKREAYFLDYAQKIKAVASCPVMVTGGIRTGAFIEKCLDEGKLDVVGMARPLALNPNFPNELLTQTKSESLVRPLSSGIKALDQLFPLEITWYTQQLHRMAKNSPPHPSASVYGSLFKTLWDLFCAGLKKSPK